MRVKGMMKRRNQFVLISEEAGAGLYTAPCEEESKYRWMYVVPLKGTHPKAHLSV
jgi:hypothetical protein